VTTNRCTQPEDDLDLPDLVNALVDSYAQDARGHHINRRYLPSRDEIIEIVQALLQLMYPGYFGRQGLTDQNVSYHVGNLLAMVRDKITCQVGMCLCYQKELSGEQSEPGDVSKQARVITKQFLLQLPEIRKQLIADVQAAFDGDPAAVNLDEVILAYPGILAVTIYRLSHALNSMGVLLMPRIMTEWAHAQTGADIHPGATIGASFFIDHATGVVVGETTEIGENVKLYQGVTLGALSHPRDEGGRIIRGQKRHPTVEQGVTIYANATVLGGSTNIGTGSTVGGSVFVTQSVPPNSRVALKPPELRLKPAKRSGPVEEIDVVDPPPSLTAKQERSAWEAANLDQPRQ
jgi:serine O-acetyltransferase